MMLLGEMEAGAARAEREPDPVDRLAWPLPAPARTEPPQSLASIHDDLLCHQPGPVLPNLSEPMCQPDADGNPRNHL